MEQKKVKCLILCMCCNQQYYLQQWEDIKQTWGKDVFEGKYEDIEIMMYTSSNDADYRYIQSEHILQVPAPDALYGTFEKTMKAFQSLNMLNIDYDCILRTNCSTIINVKLLNEFIHSDLYKPYKIYTSELFLGGWKSAPYNDSFTFRGNFILLSRYYANLINPIGLEMAKQINDYSRPVHRDMFIYDDITIAAILNTFIINANFDRLEIYQRMPVQYMNKIYYNNENIYSNTIAFFNKKFGDDRKLYEYYEESKQILDDFYINYYNKLTYDVDRLSEDMKDLKFVEQHKAINETQATVTFIPYEDLK